MDISQSVGSIRKFGNFLMCLFPFLPSWWERIKRVVLPVLSRLGLVRLWQAIQSSRRWKALQTALERFFWRDYSKDLHEWEELPPQGINLLRMIFLLTLVLAVSLPVAMLWPVPGLFIQGAGGGKIPVAAWSVLLWILSFAFGWSCLLGGAIVSNRPAVLLASACFAYLFGAVATSLPRSLWNLPVVVALGVAAFVAQRCRPVEIGWRIWRGLAFCALEGMLAGVFAFVFTPLGQGLPGLRLPAGLLAGFALGLALWLSTRWRRTPTTAAGPGRPGLSAVAVVLLLASIGGCFLFSLGARGGLARLAESIYPLIGLWSSYLWPVWYFIGIGVIFKLLKHAKILTATFQEMVPLKFFAPVVVMFLLAGAAITWSETLTGLPALVQSPALAELCAGAYRQISPWVWSQPLRAITAGWLKWVFLFDLAAVAWLLAARRMTGELLASLLFKTFLAWFLIYEYLFEYFSFARSGAHSATMLFLITVWVLWLTHVVGLKFSGRGTAIWPQEGRIPLYGAVLLFVLLNLHARAAMGDQKVVDEVFLYLFRGIVDVGLPYFLYVYAGRQIKELPVPAGRLFAAFCAGALWTLPLNAMDRFVAAGSWRALSADLSARLADLYAGNPIRTLPLGPEFPAAWILVRGLLALGAVALLAAWLQRRLADSPAKPAALIFLVMSFATGLASFSKAQLTLPFLTGRLELLLTPFVQSHELDANVLAAYLTYSLPALLLVLAITGRRGRAGWRWTAGILAACGAHLVAAFLWPAREPWLRSSGLIVTLGLAGTGVFLLLILVVRRRLESERATEQPVAPAASPIPPPLVGRRARTVLAVLAGAGLLWAGAGQLRSGWPVARTIDGMPAVVRVPAVWALADRPPAGCLAAFRRQSEAPFGPELRLSVAPCPAGGRKELLRSLLGPMAENLPGFGIQRVESWDGWFPGAYAVDYYYTRILPDKTEIPIVGTVMLLPGARGQAIVWTLTSGEFAEWEPSRWDLARIAKNLRGRW